MALCAVERPHTARYPPCTSKAMAAPPPSSSALLLGGSGPPPSRSALPVGGASISVQTAARVSSMRSSGENLWSAPKSVVSPAKVYWARRRGEHNRLELTAQTRAEGGGWGGGEEAGELGPCALLLGGGTPPPSSSALLLGGSGPPSAVGGVKPPVLHSRTS